MKFVKCLVSLQDCPGILMIPAGTLTQGYPPRAAGTGDGLEKEQGVGVAGNSWADQRERNEEAGGQGQEMTDDSAPWEEENRRWGWLHLAPKNIKVWAFLLCALWLIPLLSQLGDSGLNKLVRSCFGHALYCSLYKPRGSVWTLGIPGEACHCPNSSLWRE